MAFLPLCMIGVALVACFVWFFYKRFVNQQKEENIDKGGNCSQMNLKAKFCGECGGTLEGNEHFCGKCGAEVMGF